MVRITMHRNIGHVVTRCVEYSQFSIFHICIAGADILLVSFLIQSFFFYCRKAFMVLCRQIRRSCTSFPLTSNANIC